MNGQKDQNVTSCFLFPQPGFLNSVPCIFAIIYSYPICVVREAEKAQGFGSVGRNGAGELIYRLVLMKRNQLRIALG
jgi:hypothetical protein